MCRLALQLLGMLDNVLDRSRHALQRLRHASASPRSPTSKRNPPLATYIYIFIYMWEPKMCRLALQLLGMLGNVLGRPRHALQRPRHALQRPKHALQRSRPTSACFYKVLGVPHRRETPHLLPYKL